jgi:hypothetical protein
MRYAGNFHPEWGYLAPAPNFLRTARVILVATAIGATAGAGVVFSLVGRADTETSVAARTLARPTDVASAQLNTPPPAAAAPTLGAAPTPARSSEGASAQLNTPRPAAAAPPSGSARPPARSTEGASVPLDAPPASAAPAGVTHDHSAAVAHDHAAKSVAAYAPRAGAADSESKTMSTTMTPAGIAALAEVPAVNDDAPAHLATSPSAAATAPQAKLAVSSPAASAPSASAAPQAKAAVSPPVVASTSAAQTALAQQKWAAAKKRAAPRFATRGGLSRIAPGEYYMSAGSYENRGRSAYYRENGWNGGYHQSGGGRFQDW